MTRIAKEGDIVPGGSMTRPATEPYVAAHPSTPTPLFADSFSSDTRSNYTYRIGASSDVAVASGQLKPANTSTEKFLVPTALTPGKTFCSKLKVVVPATGRNYNGMAVKYVDANNKLQVLLNTDTSGLYVQQLVGGTATALVDISAIGIAGNTYWLVVKTFGTRRIAAYMFSSDPEVDSTGLVAMGSAQFNSALDVNDRPGVRINNLDSTAAAFDDFKVWAGNSQPFDF